MAGDEAARLLAIVSAGGGSVRLPRPGGFDHVQALPLGQPASDELGSVGAAVRLAEEAGADWLILLNDGEALAEDALELIQPVLGLFDAIFGAAHVAGSAEAVSKPSRLAFDDAARLPHALLNWWVPRAHFVRTATARRVLTGLDSGRQGDGWLDYVFAIWSSARCLKSAQPLLVLDREPELLGASERGAVLARLARQPIFVPVQHGETIYYLPYTGLNAGIEREQTRGQFFEEAELEELKRVVGTGARIVDVGANTGNHTVFFAGPMQAASVVAVEPLPGAVAALRAAVERNGLADVDLTQLGVGVSDRTGRARLVTSQRGGLGATSLEPDPAGEVPVVPLDSIIAGPVDLLKIDVEGMEMMVLAGARALIRRWRPKIFIEIANANTTAFTSWLAANGYEVLKVFSDKGHANYLIQSREAA